MVTLPKAAPSILSEQYGNPLGEWISIGTAMHASFQHQSKAVVGMVCYRGSSTILSSCGFWLAGKSGWSMFSVH